VPKTYLPLPDVAKPIKFFYPVIFFLSTLESHFPRRDQRLGI